MRRIAIEIEVSDVYRHFLSVRYRTLHVGGEREGRLLIIGLDGRHLDDARLWVWRPAGRRMGTLAFWPRRAPKDHALFRGGGGDAGGELGGDGHFHAAGGRRARAPSCNGSHCADSRPAARRPAGQSTVTSPVHHGSRAPGELGRGLPGQGQFDAAILRAPLGGSVRGDGSASPNPRAEIISGFTPCVMRYCITASARFCDRTSFEGTPFCCSARPTGALSV